MTPKTSSMNNSVSTLVGSCGGAFELEVIEQRPGIVVIRVSGDQALPTFADEAGGHRWQRIPPTERKGRVHASTVTVAVLPEPVADVMTIHDSDLEWTTTKGSGPGGQHRNKVESCVVVTHRPSGLRVRCESERSQHRNKASALAVLRARLWHQQRTAQHATRANERRAQIGSGMRGDKRRTIRCQDGQVTDHVTGQRWPLVKYLEGDW